MPKRNREIAYAGPRYLRKLGDLPKYLQYGKAAWDTYKKLKPILTTPSKRGYQSSGSRYRVPKWMPYGRGIIQRGYKKYKKISKISRDRMKLKRLGVTYGSQPRFILDNYSGRYTCPQGFKEFITVTPSNTTWGVNSKEVLDKVAALYTTDSDGKVILARQVDSLMLANSSNGGIYLTVYWCKFKKNWTTAYGSNLNVDLLHQGFANVGLANDGSQLLNATIFQNKKLMHWVDVVKTHKTYLAAGGTRKFTYIDPNVHVRSLQYKSEGDIVVLAGSIMPILVFHGTPVHDNTTDTLVSTAASAIDYVRHRSIKTYPMAANGFLVDDTDNLSSVATPVRFIDNDNTEVAVAT